MKPFPLPVVALGAGSQPEDPDLAYMPLPGEVESFIMPALPSSEDVSHLGRAIELIGQLAALAARWQPGERCVRELAGLNSEELALVNQVLGEGEVSAKALLADGGEARIQESVFAGVWRVIERLPDGRLQDRIEVGAIPEVLKTCARQDGASGHRPAARLPEGVMNAPTLLQELHDQRQQWRAGQSAHLVNLSLLPLSPADMACLEEQLGTGRVVILSRGYGNCRISSTRVPNTWRVVYYNSQDAMILNSIEVVDMPEVACAAPEDLVDSEQRLREVMAWVNRI